MLIKVSGSGNADVLEQGLCFSSLSVESETHKSAL